MPELPEVETIKTAVEQALKQARFTRVRVNNPHLRTKIPDDLAEKLVGQKISSYQRIGKYILFHLENGYSLIVHLGMSGKIKLQPVLGKTQKHDHIIFETTNGTMIYNDARRFGLCLLAQTADLKNLPIFKHMGIDPFDEACDGRFLQKALQNKTCSIKAALLDQKIICGIGNIYASESLFGAGILPTRKACLLSKKECDKLAKAIKKTLKAAIAAGGSTLRDYQQPNGSLGYFQNQHCVYNKTGQPCPNCVCHLSKTGGIQKIVQNGRSSYFCKTKQR